MRERIQDPVSVICDLLVRLTYGFLNKNFQEIKLFICQCSFITVAQNTIVRRCMTFADRRLQTVRH